MNRIRTFTLLAGAAAAVAATGCDAGSDEVSVTLGDAPLAEAVDWGSGQLAFTGRYVTNGEADVTNTRYALDMGEFIEQPVHPDLTYDAYGEPGTPTLPIGEFHTFARIDHEGAQNLQLNTVRMDFAFETGPYEIERTVSAVLRSEDGQTYVPVPLISGLGETQLFQQRVQAELATLGTEVASIEVKFTFEGTSLDGGATFESSTDMVLDLCIDCEEYSVPHFAMGVIPR